MYVTYTLNFGMSKSRQTEDTKVQNSKKMDVWLDIAPRICDLQSNIHSYSDNDSKKTLQIKK